MDGNGSDLLVKRRRTYKMTTCWGSAAPASDPHNREHNFRRGYVDGDGNFLSSRTAQVHFLNQCLSRKGEAEEVADSINSFLERPRS